MFKVEFCTTATCRPGILRETYRSFKENLTDVDFSNSTLYINIDPVPEHKDPIYTLKAAKEFFGTVVHRMPEKPNFCDAIKWCWSQPSMKYFINLEDDWELYKGAKYFQAVQLMDEDTAIVNFRAYRSIKDNRLCLSPGVVRTNWARRVAKALDSRFNPEQQLRKKTDKNPHGGKGFNMKGRQYSSNGKNSIVRDTGRDWMRRMGMAKVGTKHTFKSWKDNNEQG